jgi:mRNA interferase RelE/StbE
MNIQIQESAIKDLKKIDKSTSKKILHKIKNLEYYPDISNIKKLKNHYPPMRYRIGDYRVLFEIVDDTIVVVNIKHRKDAYQ